MPTEIYLSPTCPCGYVVTDNLGAGESARLWSPAPVWDGDICPECGLELRSEKYVRNAECFDPCSPVLSCSYSRQA